VIDELKIFTGMNHRPYVIATRSSELVRIRTWIMASVSGSSWSSERTPRPPRQDRRQAIENR
jgi:hypothetical protein